MKALTKKDPLQKKKNQTNKKKNKKKTTNKNNPPCMVKHEKSCWQKK